jgi:hypothetical protein
MSFFLLFGAFSLIVLLGVLALLAAGISIMSGVALHNSGWSDLAALYTASHQPNGESFTMQHTKVGMVRFRFSSTVVISQEGLYLAVNAVGLANPPLLIPWSAVAAVQPARLYWQRAARLSIGEPVVGEITVMAPMFRRMQPHLAPLHALDRAAMQI